MLTLWKRETLETRLFFIPSNNSEVKQTLLKNVITLSFTSRNYQAKPLGSFLSYAWELKNTERKFIFLFRFP